MKDLSAEARNLVQAARGGDEPTPGDSARVKRALLTAVASGAVVTTSSLAAASRGGALSGGSAGTGASAGTAVTSAKLAGWVALGAAVGLGTAGAYVAVSSPPAEDAKRPPAAAERLVPPSPALPEAPAVFVPPAAPEVPPPPAIAAPAPAAPRSKAARTEPAAPHAAAFPPRSSSLAEETALLQSARAALGNGDAHGALALLREHARTYPNGVLVEERLASQVFASCALGERANAARAAAELIRRAPASPLRARVLDSCAGPQ